MSTAVYCRALASRIHYVPHSHSRRMGMYTTPWSVDQYGNAKGVGYGQSGSAQDQTNGITPLTTFSGPGVFYGTTTPLPYVNASTSPTDYNGQNAPNYDPLSHAFDLPVFLVIGGAA